MNTPILFLHGFPFNGSLWKPQIEFFQDKRIVLAPDLRGHGSGPKENKPWMLLDFVDDLHELLVKAKIDHVTMCGHSMGGYIALEFIRKYPHMISSLILVGSRADADSNEMKEQRHKVLERIRKEGIKGFAADFSKTVLSDEKNEDVKTTVQQMILKNSPEDIMSVIGAMAARRDNTSLLKEVTCPTMVVVGADDKVTSWGVNHSMARRITNCQFAKVPHAGHLVSLEQPEKFNALLDTFLNFHTLDLKELADGYTSSPFALQH
ncbi:MAG: alpha/beta hydrolase [Bdellovibrionaceae bacterium]|nr:alpha/beta hydrolase [Pseudobdellovibrionaceae bacterium]